MYRFSFAVAIVLIKEVMSIGFSPQKRVNKDFEIMFETGVDEMAWDDTVS